MSKPAATAEILTPPKINNKFPKFPILPPRNNKQKDQVLEENNKKIEAVIGPKIPILPYKEPGTGNNSSDDTEAEVISDFSDDNSSINNYSDNDSNLKLPQPIFTTKRGRGRPPGRGKSEPQVKRGSGGLKLSIKPIKAPEENMVSVNSNNIMYHFFREINVLINIDFTEILITKGRPPDRGKEPLHYVRF